MQKFAIILTSFLSLSLWAQPKCQVAEVGTKLKKVDMTFQVIREDLVDYFYKASDLAVNVRTSPDFSDTFVTISEQTGPDTYKVLTSVVGAKNKDGKLRVTSYVKENPVFVYCSDK